MTAQTRSNITDLLERHGVRPSHRLGQHFLADANITRRIVAEAAVMSGQKVVEIGAGTGTLTSALVASGAEVVAYEVDERLRPVLEETVGEAADIRFEDVTDIDLGATFGSGPWVMVANLPYNVGTPLVMEVLRKAPGIIRLVVMVQREVAERFVARPGESAYGLPSVVVALHSEARLVMRVPPQVFVPAPRVESAVVTMDRIEASAFSERAVELARAGFSQRRKMLRSSLSSVLDDPVPSLEAAGIDPTARAENLSADDYLRLAAS
jgi:16S rRNA (adenine1518-N6/adenine1519-N6)-dimethyltransferase